MTDREAFEAWAGKREKAATTSAWDYAFKAWQAATAAERERLSAIRNTVRNDYWAVSFQTMGQYRTALLRAIDEIRKG